ncbi:hypothetical protein DPMN_017050 [Dreissena polymorpha]|uniref:Uncharacterized protein n=1 Tax=Dreissena polymorpha TaxID=45954 RepID=A0A9D4NFQ7_DREPO|nr:hypothetical protein DPMN_017050 [Dreissena polymorpha]
MVVRLTRNFVIASARHCRVGRKDTLVAMSCESSSLYSEQYRTTLSFLVFWSFAKVFCIGISSLLGLFT